MRSTQKKRSMGRSEAGTILRPEDRLKSAAAGASASRPRSGTRDRLRPAEGSTSACIQGGASGSFVARGIITEGRDNLGPARLFAHRAQSGWPECA